MGSFISSDGWLKAVAGSGSYNKHIAATLKKKGKQAVRTNAPTIEQEALPAEPVPAAQLHSAALESPPQTPGSESSTVFGVSPPSPASLHGPSRSHFLPVPLKVSSTPEELRQIEEFLKLSRDDQISAMITPEEFLVVSADIYMGNMVQKHCKGTMWGANMTITNEELQDKPFVPAPFRPHPSNPISRPVGYYDGVLMPGGEDPKITRKREQTRARQAARDREEAQAKAEKAERKAKAAEAAKDKGKGKARAENGPKRQVQWAEQIETFYHYNRDGEPIETGLFEMEQD